MKLRRPDVCTFCLNAVARPTREHVFPAGWYPASTSSRAQRPIVASCRPCNESFGRLEEDLREILAASIDTTHAAAAGVWEQSKRALLPSTASDVRERRIRATRLSRFARRIEVAPHGVARSASTSLPSPPTWHQNPSGIFEFGHLAVIDRDQLGPRLLEKLVRGMYRETGHGILPLNVAVHRVIVPRHDFKEALAKAHTLPNVFAVPPGFVVRYGVASENKAVSVWYFLIWGQLLLHAATFPPGLAPPSPAPPM